MASRHGLRNVLAPYLDDTPEFGEQELVSTDVLQRELKAVSERNLKFFLVCVGMLVVVFVGAVVAAVVWFDKPTVVTAAFGVTGISLPWAINKMIGLWKDKVAADLLVALIGQLKPELAASILHVAAQQLFGKGGDTPTVRRTARRTK